MATPLGPLGYGLNGKSIYGNIAQPSFCNLQWKVASTDSGGLGITGLKSNGYVRNVFMHTTQTPGVNNGYTNPNPLSGFVWIQLYNNFNVYLAGYMMVQSQNSGSDVKIDNSALTAGQAYTITTLGNASAAKWAAIGVPPGVTPAVGVSFIALTNGGAGNVLTSRVQTPGVSGLQDFEIVGNPNVSNNNSAVGANGGAWWLIQLLGATNSSTTTLIPTAPADGCLINMRLAFDRSSVTVDGL
jgi:hypothetical protein